MAADNMFPPEFGGFVEDDSVHGRVLGRIFDGYFKRDGHTVVSFPGLELRPGDHHSRDVAIGVDRKTGDRVQLPYVHRDKGVAIFGVTGTGKSSIFERLILADLASETPGIVIDPHGVLTDRVIGLAPRQHEKRIVVLEPCLEQPFGLNLLACRPSTGPNDDPVTWAADSVVATVKKLYGEEDQYLPRLTRYLGLAARTLIPSGYTLLDASRLFTDQLFRETCLTAVPDKPRFPGHRGLQTKLRDAWMYYNDLPRADRAAHIESVSNRLDDLLMAPIIEGIVGSPVTTVPFDEILDGKTMLLVKLRSEELTRERCNFIGAMLLCALADRVFARTLDATETPRRFHLYLDEYQRFATSTTAELLAEGRKHGVGVTLAHQGIDQVGDVRVRNAELQARTKVILAVTPPDAQRLAADLPITPREEWVEEMHITDGTEPVLVPTRLPITRLCSAGHKSPVVANAAAVLFKDAPGCHYPKVNIRPDDQHVNDLLVDVMDGKVSVPQDLNDRLLDLLYLFSEGEGGGSGSRYTGNLAYYSYSARGVCDRDPKTYSVDTWRSSEVDLTEVRARLRAWLEVHLAYKDDLLSGVRPVPPSLSPSSGVSRLADLMRSLERRDSAPVPADIAFKEADDKLLAFALRYAKLEPSDERWIEEMYDVAYGTHDRRDTIAVMRERLRCLIILCEGLAKDPIKESAGQQQSRIRTQIVVHPRQNHQDAFDELVGRLVNPEEDFVAHVKSPSGYHEVKVLPPVSGDVSAKQYAQVAERSRRECAAYPEQSEQPVEDAQPAEQKAPPVYRPTIGRRSPSRNTDA